MSARRTAQRQEGQPWEPEEAGLRTCQSRRLLPRPPALPSSPCCPAAESPRRREPMGAGGWGLGCQSPGGPAGRAHRLAPRAPRACAPRASVVPRRGGGGERAAGGRAGREPTCGPGAQWCPGVGVEHFAPSPGGSGQKRTRPRQRAGRGGGRGPGAQERVCTRSRD